MAVSATALTTLTNLKSAINVSSSDTSEDTYLEKLIDRATGWIEASTDRRFNGGTMGGLKGRDYGGSSTHTTTGVTAEDYIYFDGTTLDRGGQTVINSTSGLGEFHLPAWPIQKSPTANALTFELAVLSDRDSAIVGGQTFDTTSLVEWDDYVVDYPNGILRLLQGVFASGMRNYRVKCTAGFQTGSAQPYVPDDLEQLCIEFAKALYRGSTNVKSESMAGMSRTFGEMLEDPFIAQIIGKYRRFSL